MALTAENLEARKGKIGASDASVICGLNPYKSALELYGEKVGLITPQDLTNNKFVYFGNKLESVVGEVFTELTGIALRRNEATLTHPEYDWMICHLDFETDLTADPCEIKTGSDYTRKRWGPSMETMLGHTEKAIVPEEYECQCQHQMAVTGKHICYLAVLIGGNDFRTYVIYRDEEFIKALIQLEKQFMWHVENQIPPEPDYDSEACLDGIKALYRKDNGTVITLEDDLIEVHNELETAKGQIKYHTHVADTAKAKILFAMGDASMALVPGGRYKRTEVHKDSYTVKEQNYVMLSFGKGK